MVMMLYVALTSNPLANHLSSQIFGLNAKLRKSDNTVLILPWAAFLTGVGPYRRIRIRSVPQYLSIATILDGECLIIRSALK